MILWKIQEYVSIPSLLFKILAVNLKAKNDLTEEKISFGADKQQHFIVVMPKVISKKNIIFFAHGGFWSNGNASLFRFIGWFFAKHGYITIIAGYRLLPAFKFPVQLQDTVLSLKGGLDLIAGKGVVIDKIILAGQSAGAQLVSLLAFEPELSKNILSENPIAGLVNISGVINFSAIKNNYAKGFIRKYAGNEDGLGKADPFSHIYGPLNFPVLCIHGDSDPTIETENSILFVDKINKAGGKADLLIVHSGHHSDLIRLFFGELPETEKMMKWLDELELNEKLI